MRFAAPIGQRLRGSRKRVAEAALTLLMLSSVAVAGLAFLASDVLASWKAPGSTESVLASLQGTLTFEAPASTVLRTQARTKDSQSVKDLYGDSLLAKDWKYTQLGQDQLAQLAFTLYAQARFAEIYQQFFNAYVATAERTITAIAPPQIAQALIGSLQTVQAQVNRIVAAQVQAIQTQLTIIDRQLPPTLRPPPLPPASPSV